MLVSSQRKINWKLWGHQSLKKKKKFINDLTPDKSILMRRAISVETLICEPIGLSISVSKEQASVWFCEKE